MALHMLKPLIWSIAVLVSAQHAYSHAQQGTAQAPVAPAKAQQQAPQAQKQTGPADFVQRAQHIDALMTSKLAIEVDARALFRTSLGSADAPLAKAVLQLVRDRAAFRRATKDPAVLAPLNAEQAQLALAQAKFLTLPSKRREAIFAEHAARVEAAQKETKASAALQSERDIMERQIAQLEAFLDGKPTQRGSLDLDLITDLNGLIVPPDKAPVAEDQQPVSDQEQLKALKDRLAALRLQILSLPPEQIASLQSASGIDVASGAALAQAEQALLTADAQREQARREAENAATERGRLIAGERAKLFAVKSAQARFASELAVLQARPDQITDDALGWRRRVIDIQSAGSGQNDSADALYQQIVGALREIRSQLSARLQSRDSKALARLSPAQLDQTLVSGVAVAPDLVRYRQQLLDDAAQYERTYSQYRWDEQKALRDAMVLVNQARLELIPSLSARHRTSVLGFGDEGSAQVKREVAQISLDFRFHLANWRTNIEAAVQPFRQPTPAFVLSVMRILLLTLFFRWWRRKGEGILARSETALRNRRPRSLLNEIQASTFSYIRRVRRPLDWLVFALCVRWLMPDQFQFVGLSFVWIIVLFSLGGWLAVRLADELARGKRTEDPRAALRWKSLRLVTGALLGVMMVLALTQESVGKGAIYNWVLDACWLLAVPIVLLLTHWWRDRIVALSAAGSEQSAFLAWNAKNTDGIIGLIGRALAGAVLLFEGARAMMARRINDFALVREFLDQRNRTKAALQVAEDKAAGIYHRPPAEILEILDPHRHPEQRRSESVRPGKLIFPEIQAGNIIAVVGERGLGKSAILRDLAEMESETEPTVITVKVDGRGYQGVVEDMLQALGKSSRKAGADDLSRALSESPLPAQIIIDDLQRLVVPAIGGLSDLDALIALARGAGDSCNWIMALGGPAWSYVSRARFDRVLFDKVVRLPRWSDEELRALIERRTVQAGLNPDFNDLVETGSFQFEGDLTSEQRRECAFFERLTDYANGNPAIALEFWRRSLFIDSRTDKVVVRTFATPDVTPLVSLPLSAMFVLRAILQMDSAQQGAIERSTDLTPVIVSDALRSLMRIGVIAPHDMGYRINLFWWSEVVRLLERQNLIVRD